MACTSGICSGCDLAFVAPLALRCAHGSHAGALACTPRACLLTRFPLTRSRLPLACAPRACLLTHPSPGTCARSLSCMRAQSQSVRTRDRACARARGGCRRRHRCDAAAQDGQRSGADRARAEPRLHAVRDLRRQQRAPAQCAVCRGAARGWLRLAALGTPRLPMTAADGLARHLPFRSRRVCG